MCKLDLTLSGVESARKDSDHGNVVYIDFNDNIRGKITFLDERIFRYDVDPDGVFRSYAAPRDEGHTAKIQQQPDESDAYSKPEVQVSGTEGQIEVRCKDVAVAWEKSSAKMKIQLHGQTVMAETKPLTIAEQTTVQTLVRQENEHFFGGGTQNGRFVHTGKKIQIVNESAWTDNGVASPNPFYYTTAGYGVLRNTFAEGCYDFGEENEKVVTAMHRENKFSAYYFLSDGENGSRMTQELLRAYFKVTGNPILLPEYGFYEGHLNCYNRDAWSDEKGEKLWNVKGTASSDSEGVAKYESGMTKGYRLAEGLHAESLNGEVPTVATDNYPKNVDTPLKYSARAVVDAYFHFDMPLGYILPNDGYGGGYGQNGYYMQGGVNEDGSSSPERIAAVDANVNNLARFTEYANAKGVATGLWTESNLTPDSDSQTYWHLLRDFQKEVALGGATTLKTDVAWVGSGYSFQLNGVKTAYDIVTTSSNFRPNIISLDGWAGSQRFASVWTGDQTGGNWEYIRFHIPTYIGSSLSGNPNIGSDMDGIFGGKALIAVRDYQWKAFTPQMLNMDGWGSYVKAPFTFGDPYTGINRMYLKMKSKLMPYIYTSAASAANIDTGNDDTGLPMIRAMFLEYPEDMYAYTRQVQYQYMLGASVLVAPVYKSVASDEIGNDVRNNIYLPDAEEIWIDYLTGEKYKGGQVLNNFEAPLWKLPVFVKNGTILPMYEPNNTPDEINKANRIVEFWPAGKSTYTVFEDDGKYIKNETEQEEAYGTIGHISYGCHVSTTYTASVEKDTAVLVAEPSVGNYEGFDPNRKTTFIVNLSRKPEEVLAMNGGTKLCMSEASDLAAFEAAAPEGTEAVFFYDEAPELMTYASEKETEINRLTADVKIAPKLYVKLSRADVRTESQTVEIRGFVSEMLQMEEKENGALDTPSLQAVEDKATPTSTWIEWTESKEASAYEMLVDGRIYSMGKALSYKHDELEYHSEHSYRVRSRNKEGYSAWSEEVLTRSLLDPWRNEIGALGKITWTGSCEELDVRYFSDHAFGGLFYGWDDVDTVNPAAIYDFGVVYELDKFDYYPRDTYGNGTAIRLNVYSGLDGVHWKLEWDGAKQEPWTYETNLELEDNAKTVPLDGVKARFLKVEVIETKGNKFATHEMPVYKKEGTKGFAVGSTNLNETVTEGDYTNMKNYLGTSVKDGSNFTDQIQKRCGDINMNGIYDVYDYAYTMFNLDGGTAMTGKPEGSISLVPGTESVKAGETFTVAVLAKDVRNVNAFGKVIDYDPGKVEFVSINGNDAVKQMENLTVNKVYPDGMAYVNLAFANRGNKALYNGSDELAVITMKALTDLNPAEEMECEGVLLIGPGFDTVS